LLELSSSARRRVLIAGSGPGQPTFSAEVEWFHLDQKFTGASTLGAAAPKPATVYEFKDQNAVSLHLRAQRNF
jgi:hypothetical protein